MPLRSRYIGSALAFYEDHLCRIVDAFGKDVVKYEEDFTKIAVASDAISGWTITLVEAGAGETTVALTDGSGGQLLITTDANEDDGANLQVTTERFKPGASGNKFYFGCRFKSGEATQSDILIGMCITDTTLLGGMTDGIYLEKLDGGTGVSSVTEKNSTETQNDSLATFAADTFTTWEFFFDGTTVRFFIDGVNVANHTTNICDDEELTPSIHFLSGNAAAETLTIDWIRAIQFGRN